jgi:hypothetical protein
MGLGPVFAIRQKSEQRSSPDFLHDHALIDVAEKLVRAGGQGC